jgi:hypothetical protein
LTGVPDGSENTGEDIRNAATRIKQTSVVLNILFMTDDFLF